MKLVRKGVFETNSSSAHSLAVQKNDADLRAIPLDSDGKIHVDVNAEFGWENETYTDPHSKLQYVLLYIRDWIGPERKDAYLNILKKVVMKQTLASDVVINFGEVHGEGYIDHQSVECGQLDFLFEDPENLKRFIFGANSVLETGNDNE